MHLVPPLTLDRTVARGMSVQKATVAGNMAILHVRLISLAVLILVIASYGPLVEISPTAC